MSRVPELPLTYRVPSAYAPGGVQDLGPPEKPEPPQADRDAARQADKQTLSDVCQTFGWTVEQLDQAIAAYAFPKPIGRDTQGPFGRTTIIYSRAAMRDWHQRFTAFARTVPATV